MKTIRLLTLVAAALLLVAPLPAHAQGAAPVAGWTKELAEHFDGIVLSDAQKAKIVAIQKSHHERMDAVKKAGGEHAKHQLQELMEAEHKAFKGELTADQWARFEANMKAHHEAEAKGDAKAGAGKAGEHAGMDHGAMKHEGMKGEGGKEMACCKKGEKKPEPPKP